MKKLILLPLCLLILFWPNASAQSNNQTFYYVATAVDSGGNESIFSNQAGPFTPTAKNFHVTLNWVASTSTVSGYNIYRGTTTGGPYSKVNTSLVTTLTYTDTFSFPNPPQALTGATN